MKEDIVRILTETVKGYFTGLDLEESEEFRLFAENAADELLPLFGEKP
jgi:hypothetical protein